MAITFPAEEKEAERRTGDDAGEEEGEGMVYDLEREDDDRDRRAWRTLLIMVGGAGDEVTEGRRRAGATRAMIVEGEERVV